MVIEIKLPDLGENIEGGDVVKVLVSPGDVIKEGQSLLELETEKAVLEVPSTASGRVSAVLVKTGEKVKVGQSFLTLGEEVPASSPVSEDKPAAQEIKPAAPPTPPVSAPMAVVKEEPTVAPPKPEPVMPKTPKASEPAGVTPDYRLPAPAGPAVRKVARDLGVDLHKVAGSGPGGRISAEDVRKYVKETMTKLVEQAPPKAASPALPDFAQWGQIEKKPLTSVRRRIAERLSMAWQTIPHVTQFDTADITELESARRKYNEARAAGPGKLTMTVFSLKAVVAALKEFPHFNATLDLVKGELIYKNYYHLGIAVDTEHGLFVPVIRDVDRKSVQQLAVELDQLANRARQRKLTLNDMQGGTFTITNLGGIGGTYFTPIVNYPEVAILGLSRSKQEQVLVNGKVELRLILPLSLSYDHRVIDGADGARFLRRLAELLADPVQLLLEG